MRIKYSTNLCMYIFFHSIPIKRVFKVTEIVSCVKRQIILMFFILILKYTLLNYILYYHTSSVFLKPVSFKRMMKVIHCKFVHNLNLKFGWNTSLFVFKYIVSEYCTTKHIFLKIIQISWLTFT